ncbi:hypothetical protein [Proteiniphilum sp. X52]|uniref:hypothetical protein n=1 Tax=Proteiniphilum sp. X52 TaxID=2382159 RepID=UPI000F09D66C|nr:hypothetical protein [Proteiniphilum sp. X52]RNC64924.1 hypothetical protein D7D25_09955 [Proteiniphilum sp. X52]
MKERNIAAWICACFLFLLKSIAMGQGAFPGPKSTGPAESFKLTVEPAWIAYGKPNTMGKSEMEKKLFPNDNKMVEFFFIDNVLGPRGFRIDSVSTNSYIMEIAWVTDYKMINKRLSEVFPTQSIGPNDFDNMQEEKLDEIRMFNRKQNNKRIQTALEQYTIERIEFQVKSDLARHLWETCFFVMKNYKSKGIAPISFDGCSVTFRCIVEDFSLWTFFARNPVTHVKNLTTICNEMIKKVQQKGEITDEEKYIRQLDDVLRESTQSQTRMTE